MFVNLFGCFVPFGSAKVQQKLISANFFVVFFVYLCVNFSEEENGHRLVFRDSQGLDP